MRNFIATTESGAVYTLDRGRLRIEGSRSGDTTFSVIRMCSALRPNALPWNDAQQWPEVSQPAVGERLYLQGFDEWRISTPIQTIMYIEYDR